LHIQDPTFSGKYQDSENDKVAQKETNSTMAKIDKENFERLQVESKNMKFENEATLRDLTTTKAALVFL